MFKSRFSLEGVEVCEGVPDRAGVDDLLQIPHLVFLSIFVAFLGFQFYQLLLGVEFGGNSNSWLDRSLQLGEPMVENVLDPGLQLPVLQHVVV